MITNDNTIKNSLSEVKGAKSKQDVASEYFPFISPHSAVNQLAVWIKNCPGLIKSLAETGYKTRQRLLTGQQVSLIYYYLGEP